jgi:hypothetical protein
MSKADSQPRGRRRRRESDGVEVAILRPEGSRERANGNRNGRPERQHATEREKGKTGLFFHFIDSLPFCRGQARD